MTTIAYRDGIMASEGISLLGWVIIRKDKLKVRKLSDGSLAGGCGTAAVLDAYLDWLGGDQQRQPPSLAGAVPDDNSTILLAKPDGELFIHTRNGSESIGHQPFFAVGSGAELAIGAMEFGASAVQAVEIATRRMQGNGGIISSVGFAL